MKKVNRNPEKPYEDMDGNWIGLWKKDKWDRNSGIAYPKYNYRKKWEWRYKNPDIGKGEVEILRRKCIEGDKEACAKLDKLEKDNEDFLEHLMAIANYDEYPPKLKEPKE